MGNININGSSNFWFDGNAAAVIDTGTPNNGLTNPTNNWVGDSNFWYRGTPQGFLQGGPGTVSQSPENVWLYETAEPEQPKIRKSTATAVIL